MLVHKRPLSRCVPDTFGMVENYPIRDITTKLLFWLKLRSKDQTTQTEQVAWHSCSKASSALEDPNQSTYPRNESKHLAVE